MAERKWMDSILLPRRQRDDFNDEFDTITSKVAKDWLTENGYVVYDFVWDILWKITELRLLRNSQIVCQKVLENFEKTKEFLTNLFGNRLGDLLEYEKAIRQLSKDAEIGKTRNYVYFGICPDFVIKKDRGVFFLDVIANQAKPKKYSGMSCRIAEQYGFETLVLKIDVEIKVGGISFIEL